MEGCFTNKKSEITRTDADRYLRGYRKMNGILRSSQTYRKSSGLDCALDEATLQAQMYGIRSLILSVSDISERYLLYGYYIKGQTVGGCARSLGISLRSAHRLKARALESIGALLSCK